MDTKYKKSSRTLSKNDDVNHHDSLAIYNHFKKDPNTGLIIPIDHAQERAKICGYCGKPFDFQKTCIYFDERFHLKCVEAMGRGELNKWCLILTTY